MAKSGQRSSQSPQPLQAGGSNKYGLPSSPIAKTFFGQKLKQMPHCLHHFLLMIIE
jgi:hypothetical protein